MYIVWHSRTDTFHEPETRRLTRLQLVKVVDQKRTGAWRRPRQGLSASDLGCSPLMGQLSFRSGGLAVFGYRKFSCNDCLLLAVYVLVIWLSWAMSGKIMIGNE
jgi:hypothetical protein